MSARTLFPGTEKSALVHKYAPLPLLYTSSSGSQFPTNLTFSGIQNGALLLIRSGFLLFVLFRAPSESQVDFWHHIRQPSSKLRVLLQRLPMPTLFIQTAFSAQPEAEISTRAQYQYLWL